MSLTSDLAAANATNRGRIPAAALAVMDATTASTVVHPLGVGDTAPDFSLPDATGKTVHLSSLLADGPVVLAFYRGGWCPYCSLELRALQAALPEITAAGAALVAVSPQTPDASLSTAETNDLAFPVLSDAGNAVADAFGLRWTAPDDLRAIYDQFGLDMAAANGDESYTLPVPATFVIGQDSVVRYAFADPDYTKRAEPADVVAALEAL